MAVFDDQWNRDSLQGLGELDVLVVDEGEAFPAALATVLEPLGISWRLATNGYQCVREVEKKKPDLILLNDTVNDIAGLNTLSLLRQNLSSDTVPVIAFSGESGEPLREAGSIWGDINFVSKPFSAQHLADALHLVCIDDGIPSGNSHRPRESDALPVLAKILVVDSDPGLLEWVETALGRRQILAYCATDLVQARQLLQSEAPEIILVDVDVPGVSVVEVLDRLFPGPRDATIPLYIMTGLPQRIQIPDDIAGYLRKPFNTEDLLALVRAHVPASEVSVMG